MCFFMRVGRPWKILVDSSVIHSQMNLTLIEVFDLPRSFKRRGNW